MKSIYVISTVMAFASPAAADVIFGVQGTCCIEFLSREQQHKAANNRRARLLMPMAIKRDEQADMFEALVDHKLRKAAGLPYQFTNATSHRSKSTRGERPVLWNFHGMLTFSEQGQGT